MICNIDTTMFKLLKEKLSSFIGNAEEAAIQEAESPEKEFNVGISTKVKGLVGRKVKLGEADVDNILSSLQMDLLESDVAFDTADHILERMREGLNQEISLGGVNQHVRDLFRQVLLELLEAGGRVDLLEFIKSREKPVKILFLGVNGTGKTTTIAKMAQYLMDNGFSTVLAAGDTFRAGAVEQIQKHGSNLGVKVVAHRKGSDSTAVIYDAVEHAKANNIDVVLADTAGRMQTNRNLMDEMAKVDRVIKPDLKLFIGDALTGNDAVTQSHEFNELIGFDGVILAKMDADVKGGSALSIAHETKKPILFVGVGQCYSDLREFDSQWFVDEVLS